VKSEDAIKRTSLPFTVRAMSSPTSLATSYSWNAMQIGTNRTPSERCCRNGSWTSMLCSSVGEGVLLQGGLGERVVKVLVDRRDPDGRLPIVAGQGEGRALSVVIRSEDDEGRGPTVRSKRRVTVRGDRAGIDVACVGDHQAHQASRSGADLRRPTRSERMGVAFPDLAEEGVSRALVESSRHRRIPHGRRPLRGTLRNHRS